MQADVFADDFNLQWNFHYNRIDAFVEQAGKYASDPRCTGYPMMVQSAIVENYDGEGNITYVMDKFVAKTLMEEMFAYSMQNGVDLFKKMYVYFTWIDEYDGFGETKMKWAAYNFEYMKGFFEDASAYFERNSDKEGQEIVVNSNPIGKYTIVADNDTVELTIE